MVPTGGDAVAREEKVLAEGVEPPLSEGAATVGLADSDAPPLADTVPLSQLGDGDTVALRVSGAVALAEPLAVPRLAVAAPEELALSEVSSLNVPRREGVPDSLPQRDALEPHEGEAEPVAREAEGVSELGGEALAGADAEPLNVSPLTVGALEALGSPVIDALTEGLPDARNEGVARADCDALPLAPRLPDAHAESDGAAEGDTERAGERLSLCDGDAGAELGGLAVTEGDRDAAEELDAKRLELPLREGDAEVDEERLLHWDSEELKDGNVEPDKAGLTEGLPLVRDDWLSRALAETLSA